MCSCFGFVRTVYQGGCAGCMVRFVCGLIGVSSQFLTNIQLNYNRIAFKSLLQGFCRNSRPVAGLDKILIPKIHLHCLQIIQYRPAFVQQTLKGAYHQEVRKCKLFKINEVPSVPWRSASVKPPTKPEKYSTGLPASDPLSRPIIRHSGHDLLLFSHLKVPFCHQTVGHLIRFSSAFTPLWKPASS